MSRTINMIVAYGPDGVLGKGKGLPWPKHAEDMRRFREATLGQSIIMGRKTYETLGRPLPYRQNIVISRNPDQLKDHNVDAVSNLEEAITRCKMNDPYIIGGASIYTRAMSYVNRILLTEMDTHFEGDVYFKIPFINEWDVIKEEHWTGQTPEEGCTFRELRRD